MSANAIVVTFVLPLTAAMRAPRMAATSIDRNEACRDAALATGPSGGSAWSEISA